MCGIAAFFAKNQPVAQEALRRATAVLQHRGPDHQGHWFSPDGRVPNVLIGIVRADGTPIYGVATDMDGVAPTRIANDRYAFALTLPQSLRRRVLQAA